MKKNIIIVIMFLICTSIFTQNKFDDRDFVGELKKRLIELEDNYISGLDYYKRREAVKSMDEISNIIKELEHKLLEKDDKSAIFFKNDIDFDYFINNFTKTYLKDVDKINYLKKMNNYFFTTYQLKSILETLDNDTSRFSVLVLSFSSVLDKYNSKHLIDTFLTDFGRNNSIKFIDSMIGNHHNSENEIMVMDESILTDILLKLNNDYHFNNDKISFLESIIPHYNISISQTLNILKSFSGDDDKFTCLKLLYPKVIDKEKSYQIIDSFTFKSSKEKFTEYIKNYKS